MNSTVEPIFNEKVAEKWYLWDPWTVHECTVHERLVKCCGWQKKKKKKAKRETRNAGAASAQSKHILNQLNII